MGYIYEVYFIFYIQWIRSRIMHLCMDGVCCFCVSWIVILFIVLLACIHVEELAHIDQYICIVTFILVSEIFVTLALATKYQIAFRNVVPSFIMVCSMWHAFKSIACLHPVCWNANLKLTQSIKYDLSKITCSLSFHLTAMKFKTYFIYSLLDDLRNVWLSKDDIFVINVKEWWSLWTRKEKVW